MAARTAEGKDSQAVTMRANSGSGQASLIVVSSGSLTGVVAPDFAARSGVLLVCPRLFCVCSIPVGG
jgi:hypothetical protein